MYTNPCQTVLDPLLLNFGYIFAFLNCYDNKIIQNISNFQDEIALQSIIWVEKKADNGTIFWYNPINDKTSFVQPEEKNGIKIVPDDHFETISDKYFEKHQKQIKKNALKTNMFKAQQDFNNFVQENGGSNNSYRGNGGSNNRKIYRKNRGSFLGVR